MDHTELLNRMLADNCSNGEDENGVIDFTIGLHCMEYHVFAKKKEWNDKEGYMSYEIVGWTRESI